ncbi:MAG: hypothetical protein LQ351_002651 [Letrouitia transgressa]|nr:MAG: hypothetical protein LQ351_002651 [Letrouitia transgressa]
MADVEKGLSKTEHVVLNVQGMTCTGCERKLSQALRSFPNISNIKTSVVLAHAEFDIYDPFDRDALVDYVERVTGFVCTAAQQSVEEIDMILNDPQRFANEENLPVGVANVRVVSKSTIRVMYYPKIIGARDLFSHNLFRTAKLAPPVPRPQIASKRAHLLKMFSMTLISAILTLPVLIMAWAPLPKHETLYGAISLVCATIIQIFLAGPFYKAALKALIFMGIIEMDFLIVISTTTAYLYSVIAYAYEISGNPLSMRRYFETSTLLVTLILLGRTIGAFARQKAVETISIETLQTPRTILVNPSTDGEEEIDARLLQYEDNFRVLPDTTVVTDGVVVSGETEIDESMITGEATLVPKSPSTSVIAGSLNHYGTLTVRLTRLPSENTVKMIGSMVDEARMTKPKTQQIADRVAGFFTPLILVITIIVFLIWIAVGVSIRHEDARTACITAMTYAISTLVVSCPCAIALVVPMVVVIAGGVGAKRGLICQSSETIEIARKTSHIIFDKTGTLTQGKLSVEATYYLTEDLEPLLQSILGLTSSSKHPVSVAIASCLRTSGAPPHSLKNIVSVAGKGLTAIRDGSTICGGNPYWLGFEHVSIVQHLLLLGLTVFCVSVDGKLVAVYGLKDQIRPEALEAVSQLRKRSIKISIVSGDNKGAVQSIAMSLGVPETSLRSGCSPEDKQAYVKETLAVEKGIVMFCGDGTNDAVALTQANIGIHMNEGTDIARNVADAVLVRSSLKDLLGLLDLSKAFFRRVAFNFAWAFTYNTFAILLAAGAFPNFRVAPQYAGLGEIVSVLPVIAIAMHLKTFKKKY